MYKITYSTLNICDIDTKNESIGNVYEKKDSVAYTNCNFGDIESNLITVLRSKERYPNIKLLETIEGIIY